jgi:dihydrofolate reductase
MKVSIIVAMDEKRGIGKNNKIPWHLRDDLLKLKKLTLRHVVIIGRKTYESMVWYYNKSGRPMPGKVYIVITRNTNYQPERENAIFATSVKQAIEKAKEIGEDEVFIIGGQQVFNESISIAEKIYLTIIKGNFDTDAFFPDYSAFSKIVHKQEGSSEGHDYIFIELEK